MSPAEILKEGEWRRAKRESALLRKEAARGRSMSACVTVVLVLQVPLPAPGADLTCPCPNSARTVEAPVAVPCAALCCCRPLRARATAPFPCMLFLNPPAPFPCMLFPNPPAPFAFMPLVLQTGMISNLFDAVLCSEKVDGVSYLKAQWGVQCWNQTHSFLVLLAGMAIMGVGLFPLYLFRRVFMGGENLLSKACKQVACVHVQAAFMHCCYVRVSCCTCVLVCMCSCS